MTIDCFYFFVSHFGTEFASVPAPGEAVVFIASFAFFGVFSDALLAALAFAGEALFAKRCAMEVLCEKVALHFVLDLCNAFIAHFGSCKGQHFLATGRGDVGAL